MTTSPTISDLLAAPPSPEGALQLRLLLAAHVDDAQPLTELLGELIARPGWCEPQRVDDPDLWPSLAEERALLERTLGGQAEPACAERGGYAVTHDGVLDPALARSLDPQAARARLADPARIWAHHLDLLVTPLPPAVATAVQSWLGAPQPPAPPIAPTLIAELLTPALRRAALDRATPQDNVQRTLIDRLLVTEWERALDPADPGARLDHQVRRHLLQHAPAGAPWDTMVSRALSALLDSPFHGSDVFLLGERLRVLADRHHLPDEAPVGFGLRPDRWDELRIAEVTAGLGESPAPDLLRLAERSLGWALDRPEQPARDATALAAAALLRDSSGWFSALPPARRASLLTLLLQDVPQRAMPALLGVFRERGALQEGDRGALAGAFLRWRGHADPVVVALLGVMALPVLGPEDQIAVVEACAATSPDWRVGLLQLAAEAAPGVAPSVADRLLAVLHEPLDRSLHAPAATLALLLVRRGILAHEVGLEVQRALTPALRLHPRVAEELRRAGRS